jgi:hypothetical protein
MSTSTAVARGLRVGDLVRITGLGFDHVGSVLVAKIPTVADRVDGGNMVPDRHPDLRQKVQPPAKYSRGLRPLVQVHHRSSQDQHCYGIGAEVRANY